MFDEFIKRYMTNFFDDVKNININRIFKVFNVYYKHIIFYLNIMIWNYIIVLLSVNSLHNYLLFLGLLHYLSIKQVLKYLK